MAPGRKVSLSGSRYMGGSPDKEKMGMRGDGIAKN